MSVPQTPARPSAHLDQTEPMPRNPLDDAAPDHAPGWPSLDAEDHLEDDPAL